MSADAAIADAPPASRVAQWLVAAGLVAIVTGLIGHGLWRELPAERFALSLLLAGLSLLIAWPLRRALRLSTAAAVAAVWLLALAVYIGLLPLLATALLGLAALAIGLRIVPLACPARVAIATTTGLIVLAGLCGWVVTLPIFHPWLWWPLLTALVMLQRAALRSALSATMVGARDAIADAPRAATCVMLLLGLVSVACWIPAMQMDDIAYHLNLPTQLMMHGRYSPQPEFQIWSFAPWAGDVLHGLVFMLARREAHGALNALWLLLAAGSAWSIASALGATLRERWAALALFASFPPLVWIAAGMQTELAATAVLLALAAVIVAPTEIPTEIPINTPILTPIGTCASSTTFFTHPRLLAGAVLFAGLFALKLVHGLSALPLLVYALWRYRMRPQRAHLRDIAAALALFAVLALPSYVQAWVGTGNPLLPMFNDVFQSHYFPAVQYRDDRWFSGFDAALPWHLIFDTDRYVEAWDGGLGFTPIALAGAWLLLLRRRGARGFALAVMAVLVLPLIPMQYARYAYPGLALFCVALPIGLRAQLGPHAFAWVIAAVCTLNLAYQANASWLHHSAAIKRTIRSGGDHARVFPYYTPERLLVRDIPKGPEHVVLATDPFHSNVGELAGRGRTVAEHDPSLAIAAKQADADASGAAWAALFASERIRWALVTTERASPALRAGLARVGATHAHTLRAVELWRLPAPAAHGGGEGGNRSEQTDTSNRGDRIHRNTGDDRKEPSDQRARDDRNEVQP
jgi:hypothetical protein